MDKLFDAMGDYAEVLIAANEEFPSAHPLASAIPENDRVEDRGWSAYEIWYSRIRPPPGVTSSFVRRR